MRAALADAGLRAEVLARDAAVPADARALLLAPDGSVRSHRLDEARSLIGRGGSVLCWAAPREPEAGDDAWLAGQILIQHGALVSERLAVLATAARLWFALGGSDGSAPAGVRLRGRPSGLRTRLREALERSGVPPATGRSPGAFEVVAGEDGVVAARGRGGRLASAGSVDDLALALGLLRSAAWHPDGGPAEPDIDAEVLAQIVRPPARLLSETASKRLLGAAGIPAPAERLCGSASEAARFAAELDGPVVLKLVRPGLERKREAGVVIAGVSGAAAVRRAYHELVRTSEAWGPPPHLGVLVSATVEGGARLWCVFGRRAGFGRVLLVGAGDAPAGGPSRALALPFGPGQVRRVVEDVLADAGETARAAVAEALVRLGALFEAGGELLGRLEVHPLVVPAGSARGLALDALAAVVGDPPG
jgi:hypothetical protein